MANKKPMTFLIDEDLSAGLKALKERDGTPESETLRRALREYLSKREALPAAKPVRKKPSA